MNEQKSCIFIIMYEAICNRIFVLYLIFLCISEGLNKIITSEALSLNINCLRQKTYWFNIAGFLCAWFLGRKWKFSPKNIQIPWCFPMDISVLKQNSCVLYIWIVKIKWLQLRRSNFNISPQMKYHNETYSRWLRTSLINCSTLHQPQNSMVKKKKLW